MLIGDPDTRSMDPFTYPIRLHAHSHTIQLQSMLGQTIGVRIHRCLVEEPRGDHEVCLGQDYYTEMAGFGNQYHIRGFVSALPWDNHILFGWIPWELHDLWEVLQGLFGLDTCYTQEGFVALLDQVVHGNCLGEDKFDTHFVVHKRLCWFHMCTPKGSFVWMDQYSLVDNRTTWHLGLEQ
jgi:hypothetical protein